MSLEFALVGPMLILLVLGTPTAGMLLWARGAMQLAASQTARCKAIGASECGDATAYASSIISDWGAGGIVLPVTTSVVPDNACNGTTGRFSLVTITSAAGTGAGLVGPFLNIVLTVSACYPSGL